MSRKTTAFARRRARHGLPTDPSLLLNTHYSKWAMTMAAHKSMDSTEHEDTVRHIMLKAHSHLELMMRGQVPGNDTESWPANPLVWVVEFKRVEGGAA